MIFENFWPAIIGVIGFFLFIIIKQGDKIFPSIRGFFPENGSALRIFVDRVSGFFFMGLLPFLYISLTHVRETLFLLTLNTPRKETMPFFILVLLFILFVTGFYSGNKENTEHYPQIRRKYWPLSLILMNIVTWVLYLSAYEFLFRGIFIFSLLPYLGLPVTVLINASVYALAHFFKGRREMIAAIPFGLLLAYVTAITHSLWFAFFFHLTLALSNDFFSARSLHYKKGYDKTLEEGK